MSSLVFKCPLLRTYPYTYWIFNHHHARLALLRDDVWLFMCQWSEDQHAGLPQEVIKEFPKEITGMCTTKGAQGRKEAEWRAVRCFPSHGIPATFRSRQSEARHPNGCVVPHYSSEGTRRRWLGEAGASTAVEVHKWDTIYEANPKCRWDELHHTLVRGRVASDQWRLQRISWMSNDDGEGSSYQFARQNEV